MLGLIAVFTTYYVLYLTGRGFNSSEPTSVNAPVEKVWDPKGSLLLTLTPKTGGYAGIYEYNIQTDTLQKFFAPEDKVVVTARAKEKDSSVTLLSTFFTGITAQSPQIASYDKNSQEFKVLTHTSLSLKRHPSWSKTLRVLVYDGKEGNIIKDASSGTPEEFNVYLQGEDDKERKVTKGAYPALTPDGTAVVVLRNDGLHMVDLTSGATEKIWGFVDQGVAVLQQQFTISPLGKYIAWTDPSRGRISIMEISSWAPFQGQLKYALETPAFWPVFSPDEEYLAFEEVDLADPPQKPRLVFFNLATLQKRTLFDLDSFDQLKMFLTDWQ